MRKLQTLAVAMLLGVYAAIAAGQVATSRPDAEGTATPVQVGVFVLNVDKVDTANENFTADIYLEARWRDGRLAHGAAGSVRHPLSDIWHPRLQVLNQQHVSSTFPEAVDVGPAGDVVYRQRLYGSFSQVLQLQAFPFDHQSLVIQIVAGNYSPKEITLSPLDSQGRKSGMVKQLSLPDWRATGFMCDTEPIILIPGTDGMSAFRASVEVQRESGYFVLKVIIPLVLIVGMSWVALWVDPKYISTSISVGITAMLTLIAYRFAIGSSLPQVSYFTRIDKFILLSTVLVFASFVLVVVNSRYVASERLDAARRTERFARWSYLSMFILVSVWSLVL